MLVQEQVNALNKGMGFGRTVQNGLHTVQKNVIRIIACFKQENFAERKRQLWI